jgi:hypothetical protein
MNKRRERLAAEKKNPYWACNLRINPPGSQLAIFPGIKCTDPPALACFSKLTFPTLNKNNAQGTYDEKAGSL